MIMMKMMRAGREGQREGEAVLGNMAPQQWQQWSNNTTTESWSAAKTGKGNGKAHRACHQAPGLAASLHEQTSSAKSHMHCLRGAFEINVVLHPIRKPAKHCNHVVAESSTVCRSDNLGKVDEGALEAWTRLLT